MPIPLPNLDDRTFADLTAEAQALIPSLYPTWTNHNPSDPGIVVIELLAWLTETVLYQLNEIPEKNVETFLELLGGDRKQEERLDNAVRRTILDLRAQYRAVTAADFEMLAMQQWPQSDEAAAVKDVGQTAQLIRAHTIPRRNLEAADAVRRAEAPGHLSLVVMPDTPDPFPQPSVELRNELWNFFDARRLLTVRHHVVGPTYVPVQVAVDIHLRNDALPEDALPQTYQALDAFFDAVRGGPAGTGWPFGRDVYVSEIYAELEKLPLVDFVENVNLACSESPERIQRAGDTIVGITLDADELVELQVTELIAYTHDGAAHAYDVVGMIEQWRLG